MSHLHGDSEPLKIGTLEMGHSLVRLLIRSRRSCICLLRTARFARTLRWPLRSSAHSLPSSWETDSCLLNERVNFKQFQPIVPCHHKLVHKLEFCIRLSLHDARVLVVQLCVRVCVIHFQSISAVKKRVFEDAKQKHYGHMV